MPRYAAVDIGSNSVRMEVAEVSPPERPGAAVPGVMSVLASDREITRLGESVFRGGRVSLEASALTCDVLARMARTYRKHDVDGVRAVATSAIRDARNQQEFLSRASEAIQAPVEIISGPEEARLIHLGVAWRWPHPRRKVLIVDIGGGSAEIILSDGGSIVEAVSRPLGAVRLKELFLASDRPDPGQLHRMDDFIRQKLAPSVRRLAGIKIDRVIGTSATASAVVCAVNRVPRRDRDRADRLRATSSQVRGLYKTVSTRSLEERRKVPGIGPRRAEIIGPGVAVLRRVLEDFRQPSFYFSSAGVRDGLIADLFQRRVGQELMRLDADRRRVTEQMARRYAVDLAHARCVAAISLDLFSALEKLHRLPRSCGGLIEAAALLMDCGHYVSDSRHHRHSYYLVSNSALPGFNAAERAVVAGLCRFHRKSLPGEREEQLPGLGPEERRWVERLIPLLRLADALDRSRRQPVERLSCGLRDDALEVRIEGRDADLEAWAAEQTSDAFRQIYGCRLRVTRGAA